ncbi:hypothetical protein IVB38_00685 [Bradyrhizobium sp. 38]|uniref:hypothetical protein n=1 Tax=unclassified Bradyrhizobium TaxID=2631580 RepID=UPI001FFBA185|nr:MULTISPECIES: hypothetical protein [unclassified Bradyrhizobium]MCK1334600.1 hypothetical protein [Bradyrhizobium sp. 38]MCK1778158.1 hypothetical protein [Bradyrhizobium sp. 132]
MDPYSNAIRFEQAGRQTALTPANNAMRIVLFDKFAEASGIVFVPDYSLLWIPNDQVIGTVPDQG